MPDGSSEVFTDLRPLLFSIAYRMLGSAMDAEDLVQDAYLRWQETSDADVRSPRAYLATIVTRLAINHLRSARVRRESYIGPWLREPLMTEHVPDASGRTELSESHLNDLEGCAFSVTRSPSRGRQPSAPKSSPRLCTAGRRARHEEQYHQWPEENVAG